jgi:hypothetical protein
METQVGVGLEGEGNVVDLGWKHEVAKGLGKHHHG